MRKWSKAIAFMMTAALAVGSLSVGPVVQKADAADRIGTYMSWDDDQTTKDIKIPVNPQTFRDLSGTEIIEEMGIGWILGNTFDSHTNQTPGETAWGAPVTTKKMIKAVHDLGFNTIRIPVTWGTMVKDDGSIDAAWISRVEDVINYCMDEDMYVILNAHHDGADNAGTDKEGKSVHGWIDISGTDEEFAAVEAKYQKMWASIANYFKNYDEHLIFESMNEVYSGSGDTNLQKDMERINKLNKTFGAAVRSTGSNNAKRWLLLASRNTNIKSLYKNADKFEIPNDGTDRYMVSVHDYDDFKIGGYTDSMNESKSDSYANQFKKLKAAFVDKGIPVVVGECGFRGGSDRTYKFEGVSYMLKKYGLAGCIWDNHGTQGTTDNYEIFDREQCAPYNKNYTDGVMRGFYTDSDDSQLNEKTMVSAMTSLDLDKDSVSIAVGSVEKVTATTAPADNNDVVLWKSDNSRVASVSNGRIHARRIGTATITAYAQSGAVEKKITVTVTKKTLEKETTDIQTDYDAFKFEKFEYETNDQGLLVSPVAYLNASAVPASNGAVTFESSDENVVSVSSTGKLLGYGYGKAVITLTAADGFTKEIPVSIIDPNATPEPSATSTTTPIVQPSVQPGSIPSNQPTAGTSAEPTVNLKDEVKKTTKNACVKVKAKKAKVTVKKGKKNTLKFTVIAKNKKAKTTDKMKVSVKNKKIVSVTKKTLKKGNASVTIKAKKKGSTKVTVKVGKKSAKVTVKVK